MAKTRLLLTAVFGPYGVKDKYAEQTGMQMELLDNQITRGQGVHSPRRHTGPFLSIFWPRTYPYRPLSLISPPGANLFPS